VQAEQERLGDLLKKRAGHRGGTEILVRIGRATSEIPDTAKALGVDLIILGAQGESPLKSVPLGSTVERVLRQASCPVLSVR
jgi:nucleotide-binding universal stress UspA family protein